MTDIRKEGCIGPKSIEYVGHWEIVSSLMEALREQREDIAARAKAKGIIKFLGQHEPAELPDGEKWRIEPIALNKEQTEFIVDALTKVAREELSVSYVGVPDAQEVLAEFELMPGQEQVLEV